MPSFPVSTQGRKSVPLICRARSFLNTANDVFATMSCVVASMNLPLQHPRCSKVMANCATLQHLMQQESTTSWTASKATQKIEDPKGFLWILSNWEYMSYAVQPCCCPRHCSRPPPSGRRSCCHTCRRLGPGATIDRAGAGGSEVASAGVWYQPLGYNDATYGIAAIALTQKKPEKCMDLKSWII